MKRLREFESTGASELTPAEFEVVELEREMDPPCYTRGLERERKRKALEAAKRANKAKNGGKKRKKGKANKDGIEDDAEAEEDGSGTSKRRGRKKGRTGRKKKRQTKDEDDEAEDESEDEEEEPSAKTGDSEDVNNSNATPTGDGADSTVEKSINITQEMEEEMEQMMKRTDVQQLEAELEEISASLPDGSTSTQQSQRSSSIRQAPPSSVATGNQPCLCHIVEHRRSLTFIFQVTEPRITR